MSDSVRPHRWQPPGSPIPGILQARTLEWVAISFSNAWKWKVKVKSLSCVWLLATPWIAAYQAPPSMGFSRQKYWSGVPLLSPKMYIIFLITKLHSLSRLALDYGTSESQHNVYPVPSKPGIKHKWDLKLYPGKKKKTPANQITWHQDLWDKILYLQRFWPQKKPW